ncbi:hypothetical protein ACOMHN_018193 [Nucella lapillus]
MAQCYFLEGSIRWVDAYILLYSVADCCRLNDRCRLKFLRSRKLSLAASTEAALSINPVALVGNQNDRSLDRMVPLKEGVNCAQVRVGVQVRQRMSGKLILAASPEAALSINPVALVGSLDRMVPLQEGVNCAQVRVRVQVRQRMR